MMTEDDERFLRLPLSGRSASGTFPTAFMISPPFRAIFGCLLLRFFQNDRLWAKSATESAQKFAFLARMYYLCTRIFEEARCMDFIPPPLRDTVRRDGRVVDYSSLENCRTERYRGFESLSLRELGCKSASYAIYTFFNPTNQ